MDRPPLWILFGLAAVVVPPLVWTGLARESAVVIPMEDLVAVPTDVEVVRFAVAPVLVPDRNSEAWYSFAGFLSGKLGKRVQLLQRETHLEINDLLDTGQVDVALISTGEYLSAIRSGLDVEVLQVPWYSTGPSFLSYIVVRADSPFTSLADLTHQHMAMSDPDSLSGYVYPMWALLGAGAAPRRLLDRVTFTYGHEASLLAVLHGAVESAAVDSLVFDHEVSLRPDLATRLRVIHRSPPLGANPIVVPLGLDNHRKVRIREVLRGMRRSKEGAAVLAELGIIQFDDAPQGLYDADFARLDEVRAALGRQP